MASLSEHFEIIKAAIEAAKADGFRLYVDNMEPPESSYDTPTLNLWCADQASQLDFPHGLWSWN